MQRSRELLSQHQHHRKARTRTPVPGFVSRSPGASPQGRRGGPPARWSVLGAERGAAGRFASQKAAAAPRRRIVCVCGGGEVCDAGRASKPKKPPLRPAIGAQRLRKGGRGGPTLLITSSKVGSFLGTVKLPSCRQRTVSFKFREPGDPLPTPLSLRCTPAGALRAVALPPPPPSLLPPPPPPGAHSPTPGGL